jgi:hypothetical protein
MPKISTIQNSHTMQLSTVIIALSLVLSLPEVQAILPANITPYASALVAVCFALRKINQK